MPPKRIVDDVKEEALDLNDIKSLIDNMAETVGSRLDSLEESYISQKMNTEDSLKKMASRVSDLSARYDRSHYGGEFPSGSLLDVPGAVSGASGGLSAAMSGPGGMSGARGLVPCLVLVECLKLQKVSARILDTVEKMGKTGISIGDN